MTLQKGDSVPDFSLTTTEGTEISLNELITDNKILLLFFPLAFSSVCTEELCKIRDNMKLYNALHTQVAAVSVDSFFVLKEYKKANNLNFPVLSDFNKKVSGAFGCLYEDYYGMKGVSKRAAFVISKDLKIEYAEVLEDADQMPNFRAIYKTLR